MESDDLTTPTEAEELQHSMEMIDKSLQDIKAGRVRPMKKAIRDIADEIGVQLDR